MECSKTIAIDHRWLHGFLHGDFDVRGGSGGNQSDSAICGSPRCARQVDARLGRYGFSGRARTDHDCGLNRHVPAGTRRIRIVNNLKIYWDAIRIDQTPDVQDVRAAQVPLAKAALDFVGYPREMRLKPASDTTYSYSHRSMTGPYARAAGNYTRYGDVFDLLRASDDCFV